MSQYSLGVTSAENKPHAPIGVISVSLGATGILCCLAGGLLLAGTFFLSDTDSLAWIVVLAVGSNALPLVLIAGLVLGIVAVVLERGNNRVWWGIGGIASNMCGLALAAVILLASFVGMGSAFNAGGFGTGEVRGAQGETLAIGELDVVLNNVGPETVAGTRYNCAHFTVTDESQVASATDFDTWLDDPTLYMEGPEQLTVTPSFGTAPGGGDEYQVSACFDPALLDSGQHEIAFEDYGDPMSDYGVWTVTVP